MQGKDPRGEQVFFLDGKSHIIWNIRMVIKEDKIDSGSMEIFIKFYIHLYLSCKIRSTNFLKKALSTNHKSRSF